MNDDAVTLTLILLLILTPLTFAAISIRRGR